MTDNDQNPIDLDTLSDEEFMKLDPSTLQPVVLPEGDSNNDDQSQDNVPASDDSERNAEAEGTQEQPETDPKPEAKPEAQPFQSTGSEEAQASSQENQGKAEGKPAPKSDAKPSDKKDESTQQPAVNPEAQSFYEKITAPFKADGKELQVRSPEDVIRLMQMGVNYSRRMHEMKPLRAQNEMLKAQGLDSPEKLNFMIEVMKGKPEAIQKLLKDNKIDPIDIDVSKESSYTPADHRVDPKTLAFKEAIETTMASEGGADLIRDINSSWDDVSKEALRDQPAIFQNLLDQKRSGVYGKIKKELDYQRTMGFLTDVPFVQAYHQVGEAMQKAGVFSSNLTQETKTKVQSQQGMKVPLDTGTRKAATPAPNPNLSSTQQPRAKPSGGNSQNSQPDYWAMSDEDFLKLKPPN
jgi:hypothetical protein